MIENLKSKVSGYPLPEKYNQYYITKYSIPKRLNTVKRTHKTRKKVYGNRRNLFNLKHNNHLNKQNKMQGFRGFKLQVWESSDYKNMLSSNKIYPATRNGIHEVVSKPKTRSHVRSTKTSKRSKRNVFNRTGGLCPQPTTVETPEIFIS